MCKTLTIYAKGEIFGSFGCLMAYLPLYSCTLDMICKHFVDNIINPEFFLHT